MSDYDNKESDNVKAISIGLFLIVLIAVVTIFKSDLGKKTTPEIKPEIGKTETIDPKKIGKITPEELAKKIRTVSNLVIVDLRDKASFKAEHIIDSINLPISSVADFSSIAAKNKTYILVEATGDETIIGAIANPLSQKGYVNLFYLNGGFTAWKENFNQTISDGNQKSFTDQAKVRYIASDDLKKIIETEKKLVFVDVRPSAEFGTGHISGAINIPLEELEKRRKEISLGKKIILYDNDTLGAFKGTARLFDLGFPNALALSDGLDTWKKKGYEVVK